jgi:hypothetical protein
MFSICFINSPWRCGGRFGTPSIAQCLDVYFCNDIMMPAEEMAVEAMMLLEIDHNLENV